MADVKISALPAATTPLGGTELVPIVQGGVTTRVSVDNLTAGRTVAASSVGVGTTSPNNSRLHILGSGSTQGLKVESTSTTQFDGAQIYLRGAAGTVRSTGFFHINLNAGGTTAAFNINSYGSTDNFLSTLASYSYSDDSWRLSTANQERMRITSTGNVGIGTTAPTTTLHVSASSGSLNVQDTAGSGAVILLSRGAGAFPASGGAAVSQFNGSLFIKNLDTGATIFTNTTSDTERMRIAATGLVGVNNTNPNARLHVTAADGDRILVASGATRGVRILTNSTAGIIEGVDNTGSASYQPLAIGGSDTRITISGMERARIDTSGNFLLGTTVSPTTGTQCLTIETETAPTATPADTISLYSTDLSAGNTILSVYTEGAGATNAGITNTTVTNKIAVRINGTVYYLLATTNGT